MNKKRVYFNGEIAKFGEVYTVNCLTVIDIIKLISCQVPGFREYLIEAAEKGVYFEILKGDSILEYPEELLINIRNEDIIITEVPIGSKSGEQKLLAAVAIVAVAWLAGGFTPGSVEPGTGLVAGQGWAMSGSAAGQLNMVGSLLVNTSINLAISGVSQLMAPGPEVDNSEVNKYYMFDGALNKVKEGYPVPVLYGELVVGGSIISAGFSSRNPVKEDF